MVLEPEGHVALGDHTHRVALFEGTLDIGRDASPHVTHGDDVLTVADEDLDEGIGELTTHGGHGDRAHSGDGAHLARFGVATS